MYFVEAIDFLKHGRSRLGDRKDWNGLAAINIQNRECPKDLTLLSKAL